MVLIFQKKKPMSIAKKAWNFLLLHHSSSSQFDDEL
jgi:hypothetical protein